VACSCRVRVARTPTNEQTAIRSREPTWRPPLAFYLLSALQISITTRTDSAIVFGWGSSKILQSMLGNILGSAGHCIWWVWQTGPSIYSHFTYTLTETVTDKYVNLLHLCTWLKKKIRRIRKEQNKLMKRKMRSPTKFLISMTIFGRRSDVQRRAVDSTNAATLAETWTNHSKQLNFTTSL